MKMQISKFDIWQQSECARLSISIKEHNKILEVANAINAAYGGGMYITAYDHITNMVAEDRMRKAWKLLGGKNEEEAST